MLSTDLILVYHPVGASQCNLFSIFLCSNIGCQQCLYYWSQFLVLMTKEKQKAIGLGRGILDKK